MIKMILSLTAWLLMVPSIANAYLDPGTGSMLFSALIGVVATLMFVGRALFFKITHIPAMISGRSIKGKRRESIVFYSEGKQYWNIFRPIVEELNRRGIYCRYVSANEDDPGLYTELPFVRTKILPEGPKLFFYLNTLEADIVLMTTPGLDVLQIKRSKGVKHYAHIAHSAGGCGGGYRTYGLDYFDSVLLGGHGAETEIRELESKRNTSKKELISIGCTYLDVLRPKMSTIEPYFDNNKKTILLAPTWGNHGLLSKYKGAVIEPLISSGLYNVIVRPHPQSFKVEEELMDALQKEFASTSVLWDKEGENLRAMASSDIMISDFSGVVFDYIFLFEKPILTFVGAIDKRATNAMDLDNPIWNVNTITKIGCILDDDDLPQLLERVGEQLNEGSHFINMLPQMRAEMDCYPGESGMRGADTIESIIAR